MSIDSQIQVLRSQFLKDLQSIVNVQEIESLKVLYLGKKGFVQSLMQELKNATKEQRPVFGKLINDLKQEIQSHCKNSLLRLTEQKTLENQKKEKLDISLPGKKKYQGRYHPVTKMMNKMVDVLVGMGFSVELGPDIDSDFYNFEGLNFEKDHPARDMQDTFYITSDLLLRTHTSNVQVRVMEANKPPIRVIVPGRCFRNETISARSHVFFHQIEGFYIDKHVCFGDLIATLDEFWEKIFGKKVETRYRPSYFPFVEPGLEGDIRCTVCSGKGCRICKNTGWLEVIGAGMIHPEVLKSGGIDPEEYSGYAWGMGPERLAMLLYGIDDIRLFTQNDMRFLKQFP
jgi:phenylalanyl-tRNA synthetase alpha chain